MDTLAIRLPDELVEQIDDYIERIRQEFTYLNVSRADAIRQLIGAGLRAEEKRLGVKKK